ncbi:MAG: hypothetical protein EOM00_15340 [Clostridia bacterium]|jgi:hypothetical protein|nr:hypothetical protein [Clostridia bacterium]
MGWHDGNEKCCENCCHRSEHGDLYTVYGLYDYNNEPNDSYTKYTCELTGRKVIDSDWCEDFEF